MSKMEDINKENLAELFGQFADEQDARLMAEDIASADKLLQQYSTPKPDEQLLADIKLQMRKAAKQGKALEFRRAVYRVTAVAAVFLIVAVTAVKYFEPTTPEPTPPTARLMDSSEWDSEDIAADDAELSVLTAQIEQLEDEMLAVEEDSTNSGTIDIAELELEFMEIDSDFWKG